MWPDNRFRELAGVEVPIIQAPMAGSNGSAMAAAVSAAGGLGSLPAAMLDGGKLRAEIGVIRQQTDRPFNVNFFCHTPPEPDPGRDTAWRAKLQPYYDELEIDGDAPAADRRPFDGAACELVEDLKPAVVSFHFGLPDDALLARVKETGALILSSATTVAEAIWLEAQGCDAVIAQGYEAGGHRGMFLSETITSQAGTMALVPQVVDAVAVPVIAAGGIADGRGIAAAFALGATAVQIGTGYLQTPQSLVSGVYRQALEDAAEDQTALTNLFSGRPARGLMNRLMREIGPLSADAPAFPRAGFALAPLKQKAEEAGKGDFSSLWAGQAAALGLAIDAGELTQLLADEALAELARLSGGKTGD